jgi:hypothetical protein
MSSQLQAGTATAAREAALLPTVPLEEAGAARVVLVVLLLLRV